jgi:hypothetical protein
MVPLRVCVQVLYRVRVGVKESSAEGLIETDCVMEPHGLEEPEMDTVLVFDWVPLEVSV